MSKTRKTLIALFSVMFAVCLGLFVMTACGSKKEVKSIKITHEPDKTVYIVGETFDPKGLEVTATFTDDSTKVLKSTDYELTAPTLTLDAGQFEARKAVRVTYKEKSASTYVTVTNNIVSIDESKTVLPTKTEYFIGQSFSPAGMKITATLQDGSTVEIEVTSENATFSPSGALSKDVTQVIVSIGGKEIAVPVSVLNALYVEAETGYRNGKKIEQSTGGSGNLRDDAFAEAVEESVVELYKSHLKAQFALAALSEDTEFDAAALAEQEATPDEIYAVFKGNKSVYQEGVTVGGEIVSKLYLEIVKWLKDDANEDAIEAYVESEEFEALVDAYIEGTNEDIEEWNFESDLARYTAHADGDAPAYYLGQNGQGDVISFLFESSAATTGSIAFRLSSAYLYADSGWIAIMMGDIQFNKFAEFYVNGVKYDISDDVVLEGGKTEDGSTNNVLWVNWREVSFDNVAFVEGRNVIELRILKHGIAAQEGYSFAANIDTLIVAPSKDVEGNDTSDLDQFDDDDVTLTVAVTEIALAEDDDKAILTVSGTYAGVKGYVGDMISILVGTAKADVALNMTDSEFTATLDVTKFDFDDHAITVQDEALAEGELDIDPDGITVGRNSYKLVVEDGYVVLNVESDYKVTDITATLVADAETTTLDLVEDDGKVYIVIGGGTFTYQSSGYQITEPEDKATVIEILEEKIQALFYFDLQEDSAWGYPLDKNFHTIKVDLDAGTFEVYADVTGYGSDKNEGMIHFAHAKDDGSFGSGGDLDFKPTKLSTDFKKSVTVDDLKYTLTYDGDKCFGLPYLKVIDENVMQVETTNVKLEAGQIDEDDVAFLVFSGTWTWKGHTFNEEADLATLKAMFTEYSVESDKVDGWGEYVYLNEAQGDKKAANTVFVIHANGTFEVKIALNGAPNDTYWYIHYNGDVGLTTYEVDNTPVNVGNQTFEFYDTTEGAPEGHQSWIKGRLLVYIHAAAAE